MDRSATEVPLPARPPVLLLDAGNTLVFLDCEVVAGLLREQGVAAEAAVLFDAQRRAAVEYQHALTAQRRSHEDGWRLYMDVLLRCAGIDAGRDQLIDQLRTEHDRFNLWRRVPDGLQAALERLGQADPPTRLGIVSNSEGRLVELLERLGLALLFEVVVDSGVEGVAKPGPEIFGLALERMGVAAADAIYLGDLPEVDVGGARNAGLDAVLVDAEGVHEDYRGAARVQSVAQLVAHWLA